MHRERGFSASQLCISRIRLLWLPLSLNRDHFTVGSANLPSCLWICAADAEEDDGSAARAAMCRPSQFCLALPYTTCMCIRTWLRCIGLWVCFPRPNYLCGMAYSGLGMPDTHNVFTIPSPPGFQCAECPETATPKSYQ